MDPTENSILAPLIWAAAPAEFFQVPVHDLNHLFHQTMPVGMGIFGNVHGTIYFNADDDAGIHLPGLWLDHPITPFQRNRNERRSRPQRERKSAAMEGAKISIAASSPFRKGNRSHPPLNDLGSRNDASRRFPGILPVNRDVTGPAHVPAHKGDPKERFFGYPTELDRQVSCQGKDVVQPAVVCYQ